jgi:chromosome segregation ATPase
VSMRAFHVFLLLSVLVASTAFVKAQDDVVVDETVVADAVPEVVESTGPTAGEIAAWTKKYFQSKTKLAALQLSIDELDKPVEAAEPVEGEQVSIPVDNTAAKAALTGKATKLQTKIAQLEAALTGANVDIAAAEAEFKKQQEFKAFVASNSAQLKQQLAEIKAQLKTGTLTAAEKQQLKIKKTELKLQSEQAVLKFLTEGKQAEPEQ